KSTAVLRICAPDQKHPPRRHGDTEKWECHPPCLRVSVVGVHDRAIGIRTPVFAANSLASSYPASTWRITPIPGSVVSTRSMREAIMSVPSATVTCPACSEYPIPTPPPLWIETHDAPAAV